MKLFQVVFLLSTVLAAPAFAVLPGQSLTYEGGGAGPVTFSGTDHRQPCSTCHNRDLFPRMLKGAKPITMQALYAGQLCGSCHNGEQAFASQGNCARCHEGYKDK
ncbi:MAG: cytochrome c3 family protein [Syntrophotaleaceae bacterium]